MAGDRAGNMTIAMRGVCAVGSVMCVVAAAGAVHTPARPAESGNTPIVSSALGTAPATFVRGARGTILAVGATEERAGEQFALVRYRSDGRLDRTFGAGGIIKTEIGGSSVASDAAVQPDGRIVVVGCAGQQTHDCGEDLAIARYLPDGSLDSSFGERGIVRTGVGSRAEAEAHAVALQRDGKIVVAGGVFSASPSRYELLAARYLPDGSLDKGFGEAGLVRILSPDPVGGQFDEVVVASGGEIVLTGGAIFSRTSDGFRVVRLRADGSLDPAFGTNGTVALRLSTTQPCCSQVGALHVGADGRVVVAGQDSEVPRRVVVIRLTSSGRLDRRFARSGRFVTRWDGDRSGMVEELIQVGTGLIAVGSATGGTIHFVAFRLLRDGRLDPAFGRRSRPTGVAAVSAFRETSHLLVAGADDNPTGRLRGRVVFARLPVR
jgi:uncharacterized delta-60 repeat protein